MASNLKNIDSFILNSYISTINEFVGEKVICEVNESVAQKAISNNTFEFFEKLSHRINELRECKRACVFRK